MSASADNANGDLERGGKSEPQKTGERNAKPQANSRDKIVCKEKTKCWIKKSLGVVTKGLKWVAKDFRKSHLVWVKVIFLFQSASLVTLYPYLTLHLRSLGYDLSDAAVVNTAVPVADVVAPPIAGIIADKIGNFRLFMAAITFLNGASSLLLLAVPERKEQLQLQDYLANLTCCVQDTLREKISCWPPPPVEDVVIDSIECNNLNSSLSDPSLELLSASPGDDCIPVSCRLTPEELAHDADWWQSMGSYLAVRIVLDVLRASSLMLFEGAVVAIIKEHGGDYGLQKLFGTAGAVAFGPIAGKLVDWASSGKTREDYSLVIGLYFILRLATALCILRLSLSFKPPSKKLFKQAAAVLKQPRVIAFLLAFGSAGILWGFVETYLFWFLEDLGASKLLMGASLAVGTAAGVPITLFSKLILGKLGPSCVAVGALCLYSVRLMGLSLLPSSSPELSLVLEVFKPCCTSLLLIAAMAFVRDAATVTTVATVEGIFGALYFGAGRGAGSMMGAWLWRAFGARATMQVFSLVAVGMAATYAVAAWVLPAMETGQDEESKENEAKRACKSYGTSPAKDTVSEK